MPENPVADQNKKLDCDIVLKGGVTSGVVYPKALYVISTKYRFKRIGGTSAGAIAAGAAAAAQLGELRNGKNPNSGFEQLNTLPDQLGDKIEGQTWLEKLVQSEQTLLEKLFQPQQPLSPVYKVFLAGIKGKNVLLEAIYQFWLSSLAWALPGMIFLYWQLSKIEDLAQPAISYVILVSVLPLALAIFAALFSRLVPLSELKKNLRDNRLFSGIVTAVIVLASVIYFVIGFQSSQEMPNFIPLLVMVVLSIVAILGTALQRLLQNNPFRGLIQFLTEIIVPCVASYCLFIWIVEPYKSDEAAYLGVNLVGTIVSIWGGFVVGLLVNILVRFFREMNLNNYGFCNGYYADTYDKSKTMLPLITQWAYNTVGSRTLKEIPLTAWMDYYYSTLVSGDPIDYKTLPNTLRDMTYQPITFGELDKADITLSLKTTNLTKQMSVGLPFAHDHEYYYRRKEFARLFPKAVMELLDAYDADNPNTDDKEYRYFPKREALPMIIAVRMSLSFPVLLSAIRLYRNGDAPKTYKANWFSDGGITSNFPVSMFDEPLPRTPTFSIDLIPEQQAATYKNGNSPKFLPANNDEWTEFLNWNFEKATRGDRLSERLGWQPGMSNIFGFIFSIFGSAQNWRDNTYIVMPGFRDRTARVQLPAGTGGLNLAMDKDQIKQLADLGEQAAQELIKRFSTKDDPMGWENHRWIRARSLLPAFVDFLNTTTKTYTKGGYKRFLQTYDAKSYSLSNGQKRSMIKLIATIGAAVPANQGNPFKKKAPIPESIFRMRPKE